MAAGYEHAGKQSRHKQAMHLLLILPMYLWRDLYQWRLRCACARMTTIRARVTSDSD